MSFPKVILAFFVFTTILHFNAKAQETNSKYQGELKSGLPNGKGTLIDSLGNVFNGNFKKGKKDGYGELTIKSSNGKDSTLVGYWKKDQYIGLYEFPYKIISKSYMISNASVSYDPATPSGNIIELTLESVSGGTATLSGEMPKPVLTEYHFNKGSFQEMFPRTNQQKRNVYIFQNVLFPATVFFKFGNEDITVDFYETKNYKLSVVLRN